MTRLTGLHLVCDSCAVRAVVPAYPKRSAQLSQIKGTRPSVGHIGPSDVVAALARCASIVASAPRLAERTDMDHQTGRYLRWSVLVLLRHKYLASLTPCRLILAQHGHLGRCCASSYMIRLRKVAIEWGTCRSVRIGASARFVTGGKLRYFDQRDGFGG